MAFELNLNKRKKDSHERHGVRGFQAKEMAHVKILILTWLKNKKIFSMARAQQIYKWWMMAETLVWPGIQDSVKA